MIICIPQISEIETFQIYLEQNKIQNQDLALYGKQVFILHKGNSEIQEEISELFKGKVKSFSAPKDYPLVSNHWKKEKTTIRIGNQTIGGNEIINIAGPCSVESREQIFETAEFLSNQGIRFLRGGAYKPRTSPYSFQGLGLEGLKLIREAADKYNMYVVTEVLDTTLIDEVSEYADLLQIGSRNMQNFYFLKQLGKIRKPIFLKRGMYSKIEEWLQAAEYILSGGNENVILCERGIRTFDSITRNVMDITAIPLVKELSHLPIFADPSHGTGYRNLIEPIFLASIVAGADGLISEVHPTPDKALSDGNQSLYLNQFADILKKSVPIANAIGKKMDIENKQTQKNEK